MHDLVHSYGLQQPPPRVSEGLPLANWPLVVEREELGLQECFRLLRKHLRFIVLCFVGSLLITAVIMLLTPPTYTGKTMLLIERTTPQVLDFREVLADQRDSDAYDSYKTQFEILKSRTLAARVIREQYLDEDPIFASVGQDKGFFVGFWTQVKGWMEGVTRVLTTPSDPVSDGQSEQGTNLIDSYLGLLDIQPVQRTQLVTIAFATSSPELSARLANAHAQAYIRRGVELRTRTNEEAQRFLEDKLVELKARVEKSEAALNVYRRQKDIISLDDKENIVVERLADVNRRLTEAESARIALEGQVRLIRNGSYALLPTVTNNTLIQSLTAESARLEADYAQLAARFKPGYPQLDQLRAQLNETKRQLRQEIQRTAAGIESAYQAAEATEKQLRTIMEEQKIAALRLKDASVDYAILAREVDTNRQLYDSVLARMKETGVAAELRTSNVSIIDQAEPSWFPSKPKITLNLLLGAFIGLTGGVAFAFLREYLDHTLKTADEAQHYLELPNLASVPNFLRIDWQRALPRGGPTMIPHPPRHLPAIAKRGLVLSRLPLQAVTEAYRALRTAVLLSRAEEPPRLILFTSVTHGEGKTATVVNTAIVFAHMGVRVLVIDADLRRPQCHRLFGSPGGAGLTEILTGLRVAEELIQSTYIANLSFLSSGSRPPNPADLLGSRKMRDTLACLQEQYDYILIDTPPVLPVSDAVLLSTMVDGVVLVVNARNTPKQLVREGCARLRYARAKILGTVLNRVDMRDGPYASYYWPHESGDPDRIAETVGANIEKLSYGAT
jgi:succinoglycan biosynthesis transport protein ExoP